MAEIRNFVFNPCTLPYYSSLINHAASAFPVVQSYCSSKYPLTSSTITKTATGAPSFSTQTAYVTITPTAYATTTITIPATYTGPVSTTTIELDTVTETASSTTTTTINIVATMTVCPNPTANAAKLKRTLPLAKFPSIQFPAYDATLCSCIETPRTSTKVVTSTPHKTTTTTLTATTAPVTSTLQTSTTSTSTTVPITSVTGLTTTTTTDTTTVSTTVGSTTTVTAASGGTFDENMPQGGGCGCEFSIYCGFGATLRTIERTVTTANYAGCLAACDSQSNCFYATFNADDGACAISTDYTGSAQQLADSVLVIKNNPGACVNQGAATCTSA